jgi:DNA-directed RNA polymerase specialized sigma24 family protein
MSDSNSLVAEYVSTGSESAFRDLVKRYVDLVYSAAVRLVDGDAHLAEDVAQTVFACINRGTSIGSGCDVAKVRTLQ